MEIQRRYSHIYLMLKEHGHSPMKAFEILLDAARGDDHARNWIKSMFLLRH